MTQANLDTLKFYRYSLYNYGSVDEFDEVHHSYSKLELHEYDVLSETKCGYWIGSPFSKKWVSKTSKKKYAYPNKNEALENYILRTKRSIEIMEGRIKEAKKGLSLAKRVRDGDKDIDILFSFD